ncbi:MAG: transporter [Chitinophagaceae bacterium]|nr:transporter [Chitinophagaceae bacterium]
MMHLENMLRSKSINDTGFDNSTGNTSGRILNKDGSSNVIKSGLTYFKRLSIFHSLIELSAWRFFALCLFGYIGVNLIFGALYFIAGPSTLGISNDLSVKEHFLECFFFSTQTLTTVGYGRINPTSHYTNTIAAFESFFGLMSFAVLTGLLYGRFAKPKAYLLFSKNALISPYKNGQALMFRMAPYKNNNLTEAEVIMNVAFKIHQNDKVVNKFLPLKTELGRISSMALNWTVVHAIDEESPLFGMCKEDFQINNTEVMVFVKAFDEHFSNVVQQRTSYYADEIVHHAKFVQMFRQSDDQKTTVLELDKLHDYQVL